MARYDYPRYDYPQAEAQPVRPNDIPIHLADQLLSKQSSLPSMKMLLALRTEGPLVLLDLEVQAISGRPMHFTGWKVQRL